MFTLYLLTILIDAATITQCFMMHEDLHMTVDFKRVKNHIFFKFSRAVKILDVKFVIYKVEGIVI